MRQNYGKKRQRKNLPKVKALKPPLAKQESYVHKKFGDRIADPYHWLKKRDDPQVLDYIRQENQYSSLKLKPLKSLQKELFEDIKSMLPKTQKQEPVSVGDYWYYTVWKKSKNYPIHKRKKKSGGKEEILLDENLLKGDYVQVSQVQVSPDHKILAYALDNQGRELYNIYFKDLKTGTLLKHSIKKVTHSFVWANDSKHVFYIKQDPKTLRNCKAFRFCLTNGTSQKLYEEKDPQFELYLNKSLCQTWITLLVYSKDSTEYHYLPAHKPKQKFQLFSQREKQHEYHLHYGNGVFYILSNKDKAFNFKIMRVAESQKATRKTKDNSPGKIPGQAKGKSTYPSPLWEELIPHRPEFLIEDYEVFKNFIVTQVRKSAQLDIEIYPLQNTLKKTNPKKAIKKEVLHFKEKLYHVQLVDNKEYESPFLRLRFESPTTPPIIYDYQWDNKQLHFKSQTPYQGDFKKYHSQREYATAPDGTKIPLSIVCESHKQNSLNQASLKKPAKGPLLLYAYGSYGYSMDLHFNPAILSLVHKGFTYAIAHVRGGCEGGKKWHEDGKKLNKKNTFSDFISCAKFLVKKSYTAPKQLYIMGESAGGLLIGAVLNQKPELFRGAVARVPFVDCLATMLDESIPLSSLEYKEWGNPNKKSYYDYIKSYSPYNNVKKASYPYLLIEAGYHDPRVQYWEPLKWLAKLRQHNNNKHLMALVMNTKSGHFGATGRLEYYKLKAFCYSFLLGIEKGKI